MKTLVYFLSFLIIIAPTYSAYASGVYKGQIIELGKKGGAMAKTAGGTVVKVGNVARKASVPGLIFTCAASKKCRDKIEEFAEIVCDASGICTAEREDKIDSECEEKEYYINAGQAGRIYGNSKQSVCQSYFAQTSHDKSIYTAYVSDKFDYCFIKGDGTPYGKINYTGNVLAQISKNHDCKDETKKRKLSDDELNDLAKKIAEKMDDDDIKNYYNTDYDDITINNYHYYGDDIDRETNIDKYCESNSCNEISKEIEQDIQKKKYDIDDVTPENCTMEENTGKYIACNMKIENEEDNSNKDTDINKKDGDDKEVQDIPKKEDDDPLSCDTSKFHKKICDWMDWTQDDLEVPDEEKPKIKDLAEDLTIKKDRVRFNAQCPSPKEISITVSGQGFSEHLDYQPFCDLMTKSKPFVIGISGISALLIVAGSLRR